MNYSTFSVKIIEILAFQMTNPENDITAKKYTNIETKKKKTKKLHNLASNKFNVK